MRRYGIAFAAFALLAVACGQYAGVHERAAGDGQIAAGQTGITAPAAPGTTGTTGTTGTGTIGGGTGGTTTGTVGGTTGTATGTTGETGTTGGTGGTSAAPAAPATGGTTTGVTANSIKIGIHAPLTGAAPLKASSFDHGKDLYWEKGCGGKPCLIFGRKVQTVFQDDQYNPSHARAVCAQMAEQQQSFLLVGGGGTDQIQACAVYAGSKRIPYVSAGVTETGLTKLPNYFALSMSYADQVPLLVKYMKANASAFAWNGDPARVTAVITNTPNFDDAATAFGQALPGANITRPEKNERGQTQAARLCTGTLKNFDIVFPLTAPTYFLEMAGSSKCNPQYVGVGITMGLNQVASVGCQTGGMDNARFFSPAPAFIDAAKFDPVFKQAGGLDDIEFLLWGLSKTLHQLFLKAGQNLTREGFIASTQTAAVKSNVFPDLKYTPTNHFGASSVHILRADCSKGQYITERPFYSG
jgi:branched-chain amino acid transport system substrate-binding protein